MEIAQESAPLNLEKATQISTDDYFPGAYARQPAVENTLLTLTSATTHGGRAD